MHTITTILHPTDFSPSAMAALDAARTLALDHHARLVLLAIAAPAPAPAMSISLCELSGRLMELRRRLVRLAQRIADVPTDMIVQYGDPETVILDVAEDLSADLIVMGVGLRGTADARLGGHVTQQVMLGAPCPVLTAKPGDVPWSNGASRQPALAAGRG